MIVSPFLFVRISLFAFVFLACEISVLAQQQPDAATAAPPPLTTYMGRTIAQTMHWEGSSWLIRRQREKEENASLMREKLELKPGMVVGDVGCGNGYHAFPMAKAVAPGGKVYGVEVQAPYIKMLEDAAKRHGVENFVPVLGEYHDPKLPPATFDVILMVDVYHEFSHPEHMLKALRKNLKTGGHLVLVEYRAEDATVPIKPEHKMSKEQILKELNANGLVLVKEFDELPWQHMMWFGLPVEAPVAPAPLPQVEENTPIPAPGR